MWKCWNLWVIERSHRLNSGFFCGWGKSCRWGDWFLSTVSLESPLWAGSGGNLSLKFLDSENQLRVEEIRSRRFVTRKEKRFARRNGIYDGWRFEKYAGRIRLVFGQRSPGNLFTLVGNDNFVGFITSTRTWRLLVNCFFFASNLRFLFSDLKQYFKLSI